MVLRTSLSKRHSSKENTQKMVISTVFFLYLHELRYKPLEASVLLEKIMGEKGFYMDA